MMRNGTDSTRDSENDIWEEKQNKQVDGAKEMDEKQSDLACVRSTEYCKLADDGSSEKGRPRKEEIQKRRQEYQDNEDAIEKNLLLGETVKTELWQRSHDQLKVLNQQEREIQTDDEKLKNLKEELSSITDKVSNKKELSVNSGAGGKK